MESVSEKLQKKYKKIKKICSIAIPLGIIILVTGSAFKIVPTGYTGVRTTFGQISEMTVSNGFNAKIPFIQNIQLVNNKQQDITIEAQVWGETKEKTPVYASNTIVTYKVSEAKSAWIYANVSDTSNLIDVNITSSAIKAAMVELDVNNVTVRTKIEAAVLEKLQVALDEKYGKNTLIVLKVVINNMDFEENYNAAIAAKSIAQQAQQKQEIENKTAIAKAEADKRVAIANAEAKAEAKRIEAQAEADANKLVNDSLSDNILKAKYFEKWDGKLSAVSGSSGVIIDGSDFVK